MNATTTMEPTEAGWMASTPWGMAQQVTKLGDQLWSVTTASHGGLRLGLRREEEVKREFPGFIPFAGWPWLEEDCDAGVAMLLWPELFSELSVWCAVRAVQARTEVQSKTGEPWPLLGWLNGAERGRALLRRVAAWQCNHQDVWVRRGGHTDGRYWVSDWENVSGGGLRSFRSTSYPGRSEARTADLDEWARLGCETTDR